jgi:membrane protease subunit HflK
VLWKVKPGHVGDFLFNVESPESTVKAVGESIMRAVIGHSNIQAILTGARQSIETAVQEQMQKTLDDYGAEAFRDVQRASSDLERAQNEAQTYANRVVPEARGGAAKILQDAEAYREQTVAEAKGQASRFSQVYEQYKKAPDVTRQRIYLETMEHVLGGTDKTIIDTGAQSSPGVMPYLQLNSPSREQPTQQSQSGGNQ